MNNNLTLQSDVDEQVNKCNLQQVSHIIPNLIICHVIMQAKHGIRLHT